MVDVIRAPNHLGDFVLSLPALAAAPEARLVVAEQLAPLAAVFRPRDSILPLKRGTAGFIAAARELRRRDLGSGILLTPSFSSALLFAVGGVTKRRGTATDARALLLTDRVPVSPKPQHRTAVYLTLVTGAQASSSGIPRLIPSDDSRSEWRRLIGPGGAPVVAIAPGSRASSRRWDSNRFTAIANRLLGAGARVVVLGSSDEREITATVAGTRALDLGGRTNLLVLAAGLAESRLLICNDSGTMHLAAAVGTPTISLWGAGDPAVTGPVGSGHALVGTTALPCVPCIRNSCPRRGKGTVLSDAERECMALVSVDQVWEEVEKKLRH